MSRIPGLHHTNDSQPGITRKHLGKHFAFFDIRGKRIRDQKRIKHFLSLGIPPGYHDVWICPDPKGHLQATARDDRGRKQYIYHPSWNTHRDTTKYEHLLPFAQTLGIIRRRVRRDLNLPDMPKEKVLATIIRLLDTTYLRIGNEEYARENKSYGLTTLLNRHVKGHGHHMRLVFRGKSGVAHETPLEDKRVRKIVAQCQDLPGQDLFEYLDENGGAHKVRSEDVNTYLQEITRTEITAKDFRTWHGTVLATTFLSACKACTKKTEQKKNMVTAVKSTAEALGNTVAVCRKCYIHPRIFELYTKGELHLSEPTQALKRRYPGLHLDELRLVKLLEAR